MNGFPPAARIGSIRAATSGRSGTAKGNFVMITDTS
jgi:hypothetical protein